MSIVKEKKSQADQLLRKAGGSVSHVSAVGAAQALNSELILNLSSCLSLTWVKLSLKFVHFVGFSGIMEQLAFGQAVRW